MTGGFIAGGLGAALAAVALVLVLTAPARTESIATGLRTIAAAFVAGEIVLGLVVIALTATLDGSVDTAIGFLTAGMIAIGSFGIAFSYRSFAGKAGEVTLRDRAGTIVRMAVFQGVGVIGIVVTLLNLFLSPA